MMCSSMMWPSDASPDVAHRTWPGCALAVASRLRKSRSLAACVPNNSTGEYITLATGTMSRVASYGGVPRCGLSTSGLIAEKPSV